MLVLAASVLRAPDDPGPRGLWGLVALILLLALIAAHVRVLRAVARQVDQASLDGAAADAPAGDGELADPPR